MVDRQGALDSLTHYQASAAHTSRTRVMVPAAYWVGVIVIMVIGAGLRVWNLAGTDMWTDEVLTMIRAREPFQESMDSIMDAGNQAPIYYLMLRMLPVDSQLWLRIPSVVFGLLSIQVLMQMVIYFYDDWRTALYIGTLLAVHPMHISLARQARFYTLLFLLSLIMIWCFILILRHRQTNRVWIVLYLSSLTAYLTHYTALALPLAQFVVLLISRRQDRRLLWHWFWVQTAAVAPLFLWMTRTFFVHFPQNDFFLHQPVLVEDILISFLNILMGFDGTWRWYWAPGVVVAGIGISLGLFYSVRRGRENAEYLHWALLGVIPITVMVFMATVMNVQYRDRYFIVSAPALLIVFALGKPFAIARRLVRIVFVIIILTSASITYDMLHSGSYERTDWTSVGKYVGSHYTPGDIILFERAIHIEAFEFYFKGSPAVVATSLALDNISDPGVLDQTTARIWVVYRIRHEDLHRQNWDYNLGPFTPALSPLSNWLVAHRAWVQSEEKFAGVVVMLLRRPEAAPAS